MNVIDWNQFKSLDELNDSLITYVESKYNQSIHSSIDARPIDRFFKDINRINMIDNKKELDYNFLHRVTRKVKNDATISLNSKLFEVPMEYIGDKINIRYDPTSMDKALIFSDDGQPKDSIKRLDKLSNSKLVRKQNIKTVDFSAFSAGDDQENSN